ncbi:MAG: carboxypeptidase regulatory-like domain-containing protein [Saprospiraceae bacterium]|nr:carboxypeptidase regulatory-like domain-containing protein [Saprospiraceae bacterium]
MKFLLALFAGLALCSAAQAQTANWSVEGRVLGDAGEPLAGATVTAGDQRQTASDSGGVFSLLLSERTGVLVIRRLGYFPQRIQLDTLHFRNGIARPVIRMISNAISLPEVAVSGRPMESIFRENNRSSLIDYGFAGKDLLLLVRTGKKYSLRLTTDAGEVLAELGMPADNLNILHQSCIGNFHAVGAGWAWEIAFDGQHLDTLPRYPAALFHQLVEPCVTVWDDCYFFRQCGPFRQSVQYSYVDEGQQKHVLATIHDEIAEQQMLRRYREILAAYMRTIPDVDQDDILAGKTPLTDPMQALKSENLLKMAESNELVAAIGFFDQMAADSVYAPLVGMGEWLYLFDHVNDQLFRFEPVTRERRSVPLVYHRSQGWRKEVLADMVLGRVYGRFLEKGGETVLKEIDLGSGAVKKEYALTIIPYLADRFRMRNGYLYFIGQPEVNVPNRRLYKLNLFKFTK